MVGKERASDNTYKTFREWLQHTYTDGKPNEDQWMKIMDDDINYDFKDGAWENRHLQVNNPAIDSELEIETSGSPRHWMDAEN